VCANGRWRLGTRPYDSPGGLARGIRVPSLHWTPTAVSGDDLLPRAIQLETRFEACQSKVVRMIDERAPEAPGWRGTTVPVAPLGCTGADWWLNRPRVTHQDRNALRRARKDPPRDLGPWWPPQLRVYEMVEISVLIYLEDGRCWLCREPVTHDDTSMDHVIPLSTGGDHTYNNLRLAHGRCNSKKAARHPDVWFGVPNTVDLIAGCCADGLTVL
jgi:5-methylcytosine-specific restriction endonuclease McrA